MKKLSIVLLSLLLAGCLFDPNQYLANQHNDLLMQGNSMGYADGYVDGCATGRAAAGDSRFHFSKNAKRYSKSKKYSAGWQQGHMFCKEEYLNKMEQAHKRNKDEYYRQKSEAAAWEKRKIWQEMSK